MISRVPAAQTFDYAGATINVFYASRGQGLPRHEHTFAHATLCVLGACAVRKEGKEVVLRKGSQPVNLAANEWHEIEALEDGTVFMNICADDVNGLESRYGK